ncbi:P-loop containing nucleoside triphosphate hydrolase protein, partial [Fimicolochytrium jonesii]|uniref:P-loop containing nucleoside triphosphate hydrolase protein n=1 Tax=Fimicolochytrium jonesii TaxID=1396493 RepID=UPI0022FF447E
PAKSTHPTLSPARTPSSRSSKHPFQRLPSTPRTPQTVYQEAKALFRRCSTPTRLVGRNNERQELQSFLQTHAGVGKPGALYVSGIPGTGKTALVDEVVREFKKGCGELSHDLVTVKVNCMAMKDPKMVYAKIIGEIEPDSHYSTKDAFKPLENAIVVVVRELMSNSPKSIVILDEIDTLLTRDQDVLYTLFEWPHLAGSRLILIGIANALDLTDRFLPRLKARNCAPRLLNFTPYDIKEITQIIKERLRCLESSETDTLRENVLSPASTTKIATTVLGNMTPTTRAKVGTPLMQDMAIELCARKMAGTGDLRKALDVCRHAIEMVEAESKKKVANGSVFHNNSFAANPAPGTPTPRRNASLTSTAAETPLLMDTPLSSLDTLPKVTVKHILSATNAVFGSPVVNRIKALSLHCKMVLCALVVMARAPGGGRDTTMSKVYETYVTLSKHPRIDIQPVTRTELQDVITNLETAALVTLSN